MSLFLLLLWLAALFTINMRICRRILSLSCFNHVKMISQFLFLFWSIINYLRLCIYGHTNINKCANLIRFALNVCDNPKWIPIHTYWKYWCNAIMLIWFITRYIKKVINADIFCSEASLQAEKTLPKWTYDWWLTHFF